MTSSCVCCGGILPAEGRQVCRTCEEQQFDRTALYDDICGALTEYEFRERLFNSKQNFEQQFYRLLVRVQNYLTGEIH